MRTLFAISTLALIALLWAGLSIAQHVRRTRRRRRREQAEAARGPAPNVELSFTELTPYTEAVVSRVEHVTPAEPEPAPPAEEPAAAVSPKPTFSEEQDEETLASDYEGDEPVFPRTESHGEVTPRAFFRDDPEPVEASTVDASMLEAVVPLQTPAQAVEILLPVEQPSSRVEEAELVEPAAVANESAALPPVEAPSEPAKVPALTPEPPVKPALPGFPKPARPASPKHPLSKLLKKMERPDWAYFNKDMGDLTDPYEAPRSKSKDRAGN